MSPLPRPDGRENAVVDPAPFATPNPCEPERPLSGSTSGACGPNGVARSGLSVDVAGRDSPSGDLRAPPVFADTTSADPDLVTRPREPGGDTTWEGDRPVPMLMAFVRTLVHDVRSPLVAARGAVEELEREADEHSSVLLGIVARALHRVDETTRRVLELDDLDDALSAEMAPFDIVDVVSRVVAAQSTRPELVVRGRSHPQLLGHERLVAAAISHLVDNAYDHTPIETRVTVLVDTSDAAVFVDVVDDGPGVPEHLREQVFRAFDRGAAPPSRGGFGLGLTVARRVAEAHGGAVTVGQAVEAGAVFRLELPLR